MKEYFFVSGMPRSGSTLLMNILGQNQDFHVTGTSGILDIIFSIRNTWESHVEFQASPDPEAKLRVMKGMLESFYSATSRKTIFDKSRGWLAHLEMAESLLGKKAKVIVPVRDLRDVISSFEKLWRKTSAINQLAQERNFYFDFQSVAGRCKTWLRTDQPVGLAYTRIEDALLRGFRDRMHFVKFEDLTSRPSETIKGIYKFLELKPFKHNFDNVKQITWENDLIHGIQGLHDIRSKVEPSRSDAEAILGSQSLELLKGPYPWDVQSNP